MQRRAILAIVAFATSYGCRAEKGSVPEEPIGEAGASGAPAMATIEVRVLASEQPTWPSTVTVSVTLEDSAETDAAAQKVTEQSIRAAGACPSSKPRRWRNRWGSEEAQVLRRHSLRACCSSFPLPLYRPSDLRLGAELPQATPLR
jgi:hypothetical protein